MASNQRVIAELTEPRPNASASGLYIQYGCGLCAPEGWMNFDASYTLLFERIPLVGKLYTKNRQRFPASVRYGDIVKGLPLPAGSASGIYASHVLEHLAYEDCVQALRNTHRLLSPNGIFRLVVPNLEVAARHYLAMYGQHSPFAAETLMEEMCMGKRTRPRGLVSLIHTWLNTSAHLWMWDHLAMQRVLEAQGFKRVRRCRFDDCDDPMFARVEDPQRFEGALAIEAHR
jgi:hypothetical protein